MFMFMFSRVIKAHQRGKFQEKRKNSSGIEIFHLSTPEMGQQIMLKEFFAFFMT